MSESDLKLIFDGPAVMDGEIDVQELAPVLVAMNDLMQAANASINGQQAEVTVKVRATSHGSFEVGLSLVQSLMDTTVSLLEFADENKEGLAAANDLVDLIFKVTTATGVAGGGLFSLLIWLRGKSPDKIEQKSGDVHVHVGDNYFVTNVGTIQLAEDLPVRQQAKKIVSTLNNSEISKLVVQRTGLENLEIGLSDVGHFEVPDVDEEELENEVRQMTLQIISLSFKEDNKWRVTDGAEPFSVTIEDTDFLNQIATDQIAFSKHDYLVCEVREKQSKSSKGLKKERIILKVKEHKPSARQLKLL